MSELDVESVVKTFVNEAARLGGRYAAKEFYLELPSAQRLLEASPEARWRAALVLARLCSRAYAYTSYTLGAEHLADTLLRGTTGPADVSSLLALLKLVVAKRDSDGVRLPLLALLSHADDALESDRCTDQERARLLSTLEALESCQAVASLVGDSARVRKRIRELVTRHTAPDTARLDMSDPWARALADHVGGLPAPQRELWGRLLRQASLASGSKPKKGWEKQARAAVGQLTADQLEAALRVMAPLLGKPGEPRVFRTSWGTEEELDPRIPQPCNEDALKGLLWSTTFVDDPRVSNVVGDIVLACFKKIPGHGPVSRRVGNAGIWALGHLPGKSAVIQLQRVLQRVKYAQAQRLVEKALDEAAERAGMTRDDLSEVAVPTFGLTLEPDGSAAREEQLGDMTAIIRLAPGRKPKLLFRNARGRELKSVPKVVREDDASRERAAALKRDVKEIHKAVEATKGRIERQCIAPRTWTWTMFRERYLDHPLVGGLARRLVWRVGERAVMWSPSDGAVVDVFGELVEPSGDWPVTLWHPIEAEPAEVEAWREHLVTVRICQPFKQAYREIYRLTDAERATEVYSNRFAGHVIVQHRFKALAEGRGWGYGLQGAWDSHNVPSRLLPGQLTVEFWVEPFAESEQSASGIYLYLGTDQVRFRPGLGEHVALDRVAPRVFSEAMRDVDLFVAVCSVGNDPDWQDGGRADAFGDYWQSFSFGPLGATAQTRHAVLERLIPKLAIADRCELEDRFLRVRGDLRTYRIHLQSSNILMEPNDEYLCIVPDRAASRGGGEVFLPFDDDRQLALILSKAFLLANDAEIGDSMILSQIRRR